MTQHEHDAAIARLEVEVRHLIESGKRRDAIMERMAEQLDALHGKLDQAEGGIKVLRWLGFGSLAGAIASLAAFYAWIKGAAH